LTDNQFIEKDLIYNNERKSMSLNFKKAKDIDSEMYISFLLYGNPGVGKSWVAYNTKKRVLYVATEMEQTQETIKQVLNHGHSNPDTDIVTVSHPNDFIELFRLLHARIAKDGKLPYETIVLDHVGNLQKMMRRYYTLDGKYKADNLSFDTAEKEPGWGKKNKMDSKTLQIIEMFTAIPKCNFILLAHRVEKFNEASEQLVKPAIDGGDIVMSNICGKLSLIGYMMLFKHGGKNKRIINFTEDSKIISRGHINLNDFEPADLDLILAKINKEVPKNTTLEEFYSKQETPKETPKKEPVNTNKKEPVKKPAKPVIPEDNKKGKK